MNTTVTPAMKAENVADNGIQRKIEGGDHRLLHLLQLYHRGQHPPVEPAARDRGRRQDLPGRVVDRRRRDDARRRAEPPVTATT